MLNCPWAQRRRTLLQPSAQRVRPRLAPECSVDERYSELRRVNDICNLRWPATPLAFVYFIHDVHWNDCNSFFSSLMNCIQFFCSLHWKWGSEYPFFITQFQYTSSSKRTLYLYHTITLSRRSTRARVSLSTRSPVTDNRSRSVGRAVCLRPRQGANWGDSALCPGALLARGETASTQSGASRERATSRLPTSQPQCRICGGCDSRPFLKLQTRYARCSLYLPSRVFSLKTINKISRKWRWKKGKYTNDDSLFNASSLPVMN